MTVLGKTLGNGYAITAVLGRAAVMDAARFKTLERLNTTILERVLAFAQVRRAHSELVKLSPPIPGFSGQITIAMTRSKASGV